jgi:hypothetical protein
VPGTRAGIVLENGAKLVLGSVGHPQSLRLTDATDVATIIQCQGSCDVFVDYYDQGKGAVIENLTAAEVVGVTGVGRGRVRVYNVPIMGLHTGVVSADGRVEVVRSTLTVTATGVRGARKLLSRDSAITATEPSGTCLAAAGLGGSVQTVGVTLAGCGRGIDGGARVTATDTTITGAAVGVHSGGSARLDRTTVTGSGDVDVETARPPRAVDLTCDTSRVAPPGTGSWGVCRLDP